MYHGKGVLSSVLCANAKRSYGPLCDLSLAVSFSVFQTHLRPQERGRHVFTKGAAIVFCDLYFGWAQTRAQSRWSPELLYSRGKVLSNMCLTVNVIHMPHSVKVAVGIGQLHTGKLLFGADHSNKSLQ